jgi:hypothetical protein
VPATVRFAVRTIPPSAHLVVDGVEQHNPYVVEVAADGRLYEVRADAPGFAPYHSTVKLDGPQDLEIALEDKKGTRAHHGGERTPSLPRPPPTAATSSPTSPVSPPAQVAAPTGTSPTTSDTKKDDRTYKGTKGTLITDYPESK